MSVVRKTGLCLGNPSIAWAQVPRYRKSPHLGWAGWWLRGRPCWRVLTAARRPLADPGAGFRARLKTAGGHGTGAGLGIGSSPGRSLGSSSELVSTSVSAPLLLRQKLCHRFDSLGKMSSPMDSFPQVSLPMDSFLEMSRHNPLISVSESAKHVLATHFQK